MDTHLGVTDHHVLVEVETEKTGTISVAFGVWEANERLVGSLVFKTSGGTSVPRRVRFPSASAILSLYYSNYYIFANAYLASTIGWVWILGL